MVRDLKHKKNYYMVHDFLDTLYDAHGLSMK